MGSGVWRIAVVILVRLVVITTTTRQICGGVFFPRAHAPPLFFSTQDADCVKLSTRLGGPPRGIVVRAIFFAVAHAWS